MLDYASLREFSLGSGGHFSPHLAEFFGLHHLDVESQWSRRRESSQVLSHCMGCQLILRFVDIDTA